MYTSPRMIRPPRAVLITGVGSGIGLGLARACLARGDRVYALGRRSLPGGAPPAFRFEACDLADYASIAPSVERLLADMPRLDLAVLNAGMLGTIGDMGEVPLAEMKAVMDVNLWANKGVLDALFAGGREVGQVVAVSSGAAVSGARGWNAYALSKAALNMLVKLYAAERPGTHFSALAPGLVDTPMQEAMRARSPDPRFSTVERLRKAWGTADMPGPDAAAARLLLAFDRLLDLKSGDFHDIRALH
jgi:benzil reductase ((S)-benzoin forming)